MWYSCNPLRTEKCCSSGITDREMYCFIAMDVSFLRVRCFIPYKRDCSKWSNRSLKQISIKMRWFRHLPSAVSVSSLDMSIWLYIASPLICFARKVIFLVLQVEWGTGMVILRGKMMSYRLVSWLWGPASFKRSKAIFKNNKCWRRGNIDYGSTSGIALCECSEEKKL